MNKEMLDRRAANQSRMSEDTLRLRHLIGEMVTTPDGTGVLLGQESHSHNGLYFEDQNRWIVWYGMDNVQNRKVSWVYGGGDIKAAE